MRNPAKQTENHNNFSTAGQLRLFLVLCFGLTFLWFAITLPHRGTWETWNLLSDERQSLVLTGMLCPMIAQLLTRFITREGFSMTGKDSLMLGITFSQQKWLCYVTAVFLPLIMAELGNLIAIAICPDIYTPISSMGLSGNLKRLFYLQPLKAMVTGILHSYKALGVAGGIYGYMMQKLMRITSRRKSFLTCGIIFGLLHAPLIRTGLYFGTNYRVFPFIGILIQCLYCILLGILLTTLTEISGSVWPAAILYSINNTAPGILTQTIHLNQTDGMKGTYAFFSGQIIILLMILIPVRYIRVWFSKKPS